MCPPLRLAVQFWPEPPIYTTFPHQTPSHMRSWIHTTPGRWLPMLGWMSLIFIMSGRQSNQLPNLGLYDLFFKKGAHLAAYAILMLLALWAVRDWRWALAITIGYAMSDEYHQTFVPTRQGTAVDVLVDSAGAILALLGVRWWGKR